MAMRMFYLFNKLVQVLWMFLVVTLATLGMCSVLGCLQFFPNALSFSVAACSFFYSETMIHVQADYCLFLNMTPWDFFFSLPASSQWNSLHVSLSHQSRFHTAHPVLLCLQWTIITDSHYFLPWNSHTAGVKMPSGEGGMLFRLQIF